MGMFSWMYANYNNGKHNGRALRVGHQGYLLLPDGSFLREPCYDGYGNFAGQDVYTLVADWNREFLASHPDFVIPQHPAGEVPGKRVSEFFWYGPYADLSMDQAAASEAIFEAAKKAAEVPGCWAPLDKDEVWRYIGIDIACYDDQNAALPFPIKVCSRKVGRAAIATLPASEGDPNQGW